MPPRAANGQQTVSLGLLAGTFLRLAASCGSSHCGGQHQSVTGSAGRRAGRQDAGTPGDLPVVSQTAGFDDWTASTIVAPRPLEWSRRSQGHLGRLGFVTTPQEATMVEVGDRILVESEKVGSVTRSGVVTAVDGRLITVRWDAGSQSVFVPSAGSLQITGHEQPSRERESS
jgi:hypothetical protein